MINRGTEPMSKEGHTMTNKVNVKSTHAHKALESQFPVCESFTAFFNAREMGPFCNIKQNKTFQGKTSCC